MSSPLKTNTETIQNLINQINALPDASSSSGGTSVETCTVVICGSSISEKPARNIYSISYMTVDDNGKITYACITPNSSDIQTLTCLCNSVVAINYEYNGLYLNNLLNVQVLCYNPYFVSFGLQAAAEETVLIEFIYNSSGGV